MAGRMTSKSFICVKLFQCPIQMLDIVTEKNETPRPSVIVRCWKHKESYGLVVQLVMRGSQAGDDVLAKLLITNLLGLFFRLPSPEIFRIK